MFRRTCREASLLIISREDQALGLQDRIALKLHLMVCSACPKFENQVVTMRAAFAKWRVHGPEADAAGSFDSAEAAGK